MNNVFKILAVSAIVLGSAHAHAAGAAEEESLLDAAFGAGSLSPTCFAPTIQETEAVSARFDRVLRQLVEADDFAEAKRLKGKLEILASVDGLVDIWGDAVISAFDAYRKYLKQIAQNRVNDTYGLQTMETRGAIFGAYARRAQENWRVLSGE